MIDALIKYEEWTIRKFDEMSWKRDGESNHDDIYDTITLPSRLFLLFPIPSFCRIIYMIHKSDISCRVCETDTMMFPLTPTPRARYRIWTRSSKFREIPTHVGDRFRISFLAYRARTRTYARTYIIGYRLSLPAINKHAARDM